MEALFFVLTYVNNYRTESVFTRKIESAMETKDAFDKADKLSVSVIVFVKTF